MTDQPTFRGTPPNTKQLKAHLGSLALWDATVAMIQEYGAEWKWAHSEATNAWSYRAYLPGERFFVAISLVPEGFELSLNLKPEEWEWVTPQGKDETAYLDGLRDQALASGDNPAWLHIRMTSEDQFAAIAKLLFARGRRVQAPRKSKKRR